MDPLGHNQIHFTIIRDFEIWGNHQWQMQWCLPKMIPCSDDRTILFGYNYCCYILETLKGEPVANPLHMYCKLQSPGEWCKYENLNAHSNNTFTTDAAATMDKLSKAEINLKTLIPDEVDVNNLTAFSNQMSDAYKLKSEYIPRASQLQRNFSPILTQSSKDTAAIIITDRIQWKFLFDQTPIKQWNK